MDNNKEKEALFIKQAKGFVHAGRGIMLFIKTTPKAWFHLFVMTCAVILGIYFHVTSLEWIMLIFAGSVVIVAEAFNTAIEIDINLTSPEYHPYARDTKDVAAGAVLIASLMALIVGIVIFFPYILVSFL